MSHIVEGLSGWKLKSASQSCKKGWSDFHIFVYDQDQD